jgi:hypothetical protein
MDLDKRTLIDQRSQLSFVDEVVVGNIVHIEQKVDLFVQSSSTYNSQPSNKLVHIDTVSVLCVELREKPFYTNKLDQYRRIQGNSTSKQAM